MTVVVWLAGEPDLEAGFQNVERYGDFQANYDFYDPDFIIQVAKK